MYTFRVKKNQLDQISPLCLSTVDELWPKAPNEQYLFTQHHPKRMNFQSTS